MVDEKYIRSIGEYMDYITELGSECMGEGQKKILWFRGLSHVRHELIPSLLRGKARVEKELNDYSALHYAEDIRTQHYIAKNFHYFSNIPQSRVEWLEVMQHHGVSTRVLDWSESSIHSLVFALESFLDNRKFCEAKRRDCVPCVWVLNPQKLNQGIIAELMKDRVLIEDLIDELGFTLNEKTYFEQRVEELGRTEYNTTAATEHLDYIFNLSTLNDEILRERSRLKYLLLHGSVVHVHHYLLARIYSDGHILNNRILAPLAVVHPYHSERIKAQKGVFTVFPYYREQEEDKSLRDMKINPDALENNPIARECLHKIVIQRPQYVAEQILSNGINVSWLYPEMPIVSNEIENRRVY